MVKRYFGGVGGRVGILIGQYDTLRCAVKIKMVLISRIRYGLVEGGEGGGVKNDCTSCSEQSIVKKRVKFPKNSRYKKCNFCCADQYQE